MKISKNSAKQSYCEIPLPNATDQLVSVIIIKKVQKTNLFPFPRSFPDLFTFP